MHKITNRTAQPHDIHTRNGVKPIHAHGTLTAEFDPAYLEIIKLSFDVEKVGEKVESRGGDTTSSVDPRDALRAEYLELSGENANKRWSESRLRTEIDALLES